MFPFSRGLFEDKVANLWFCLDVVFKLRRRLPVPQLAKLALASTLRLVGWLVAMCRVSRCWDEVMNIEWDSVADEPQHVAMPGKVCYGYRDIFWLLMGWFEGDAKRGGRRRDTSWFSLAISLAQGDIIHDAHFGTQYCTGRCSSPTCPLEYCGVERYSTYQQCSRYSRPVHEGVPCSR